MSEALDNSPKPRSKSSLPRSPRSPKSPRSPRSPRSLVPEPLVICNYREHPTGNFGCFRCIDDVLLQRLLLMVSENKVKVFSVPVVDRFEKMMEGKKYVSRHLTHCKGDEATKPDSETFFRFLKGNNICFKIFFLNDEFNDEYENVKILKHIPSVEAVVGGQAAVGVEEQPNFLQKFTTYYEYEYETACGGKQSSCAFMLDFTDNVKMVQKKDERLFNIDTNRIYIILNKFCNNKITKDQIISKKFESDIKNAIKILNSHGYEHGDTHLGNVVDCGESSDPRYKLIDFGLMDRTSSFTNDVEYFNSNIHTFHDGGASAPKSEEHEGGKIRYKFKFKRSRRRKTRTKTKSKSKSKNKRRTRRK